MIDTSQFAFAKPGHRSGRLVLKGKKYSDNKRRVWEHQARCCSRCPRPIVDPREAHFHHTHGRGMGGGKRDDRKGEVLCVECHENTRIERSYIDGVAAVGPAQEPTQPI